MNATTGVQMSPKNVDRVFGQLWKYGWDTILILKTMLSHFYAHLKKVKIIFVALLVFKQKNKKWIEFWGDIYYHQ